MSRRVLFLDGRFRKANEALRECLSPVRLSGQGVFETMRAYRGEIFLLDEHLKRLLRGLITLKIKPLYSKKEITGWLYETLRCNRLQNARIRLTVWKESRRRHISIIALSYKPYSVSKYKKGFKARVFGVCQEAAHIKSIHCRSLMRAYQKAAHKGCDEAILLNRRGELVEGSRTNIFFVKRGVLLTPGLKCGGLNGITRQTVLRLARKNRIKTKSAATGLKSLLDCDEAFLTNSLIEIMPLTSLNGHRINKGKVGPVTTSLSKRYQKLTPKSSCPEGGNLL